MNEHWPPSWQIGGMWFPADTRGGRRSGQERLSPRVVTCHQDMRVKLRNGPVSSPTSNEHDIPRPTTIFIVEVRTTHGTNAAGIMSSSNPPSVVGTTTLQC